MGTCGCCEGASLPAVGKARGADHLPGRGTDWLQGNPVDRLDANVHLGKESTCARHRSRFKEGSERASHWALWVHAVRNSLAAPAPAGACNHAKAHRQPGRCIQHAAHRRCHKAAHCGPRKHKPKAAAHLLAGTAAVGGGSRPQRRRRPRRACTGAPQRSGEPGRDMDALSLVTSRQLTQPRRHRRRLGVPRPALGAGGRPETRSCLHDGIAWMRRTA